MQPNTHILPKCLFLLTFLEKKNLNLSPTAKIYKEIGLCLGIVNMQMVWNMDHIFKAIQKTMIKQTSTLGITYENIDPESSSEIKHKICNIQKQFKCMKLKLAPTYTKIKPSNIQQLHHLN